MPKFACSLEHDQTGMPYNSSNPRKVGTNHEILAVSPIADSWCSTGAVNCSDLTLSGRRPIPLVTL